jgi:hypothetical protein
MLKKEQIKEGLKFILLLIVVSVGSFYTAKILHEATPSTDYRIQYKEWEKFKEYFETETEKFREKNFEESQLWQEREEKNPLPVELRRERFVVFNETLKLHKKYLTMEEYAKFCLIYRDMQERKLEIGEVKLMMYLISKVMDNATPEEMKVFEQGKELDKKIKEYYARTETPAKEMPLKEP